METNPPRGMRDFLPRQVAARERVLATIKGVFESYGYAPLETPALERLEVLTGKYGEEADRLIFRVLKRGEGAEKGESDLGLRYDLTVPLARVVAGRRDLPLPFKRYQIQPVWRAERPQKGRFREFMQCDVDCVGTASVLADAEVIAVVHECLKALDFKGYKISVNHRKILSAFMDHAGVPDALKFPGIRALDKLDKVGETGVREELARAGTPATAIENILNALNAAGGGGDFAGYVAAAEKAAASPEGREGVAEMTQLAAYLKHYRVPDDALSYDLHMARGLDYYTGPIFEATVPAAGVGAVAGGGRYDHLILLLGGPDLPATGVSLGLERIFAIMEEGAGAANGGRADVLVTIYGADLAREAVSLAADLREAGFRCEVYLEPAAKLEKQFKYADAKGIPVALIVGPAEMDAGTVAVKDLRAREQRQVARDDLPSHLRSLLTEK